LRVGGRVPPVGLPAQLVDVARVRPRFDKRSLDDEVRASKKIQLRRWSKMR